IAAGEAKASEATTRGALEETRNERDRANTESKNAELARAEADRRARVAESRRLVSEALLAGDTYPIRGLLLAVEAIRTTRNFSEPDLSGAEQFVLDRLPSVGGTPLSSHEGPVFALALSSDGTRLVTGSADKTARVWDLAQADPNTTVRTLR